jgi:arsenate reductase
MARVLFVCVENSGRSQMTAALFARAGDRRHEARSAGTSPAQRVNPDVVEAMKELGIDISAKVPQRLEREAAEWADVVVTMGCGDECPYIPGKRYLDWELRDPKGLSLGEIRKIRDDIAVRVDRLVADLDSKDGQQ